MCVCCLLIVPLHLDHVDKKLCKVNMPVCVLQFFVVQFYNVTVGVVNGKGNGIM